MTAEIVVSEWPRNSREVLRVRLSEFKGQPVVCIRAWFPKADGGLAPGRDGLTVSVRHLPALAEAINRALELSGSPPPEGQEP
jgi:hypothetical protein